MTDNIIKFPEPEKQSETFSPEYQAVLNAVIDDLSFEEEEALFMYLWCNGHVSLSFF